MKLKCALKNPAVHILTEKLQLQNQEAEKNAVTESRS